MEGTENSNTNAGDGAGDGANGAAPAATGQATAPAAAAATAKPAKAAKAAKAAGKPVIKNAGTAGEAEADPTAKTNPNPQTVEIWPLRSYQDAGEIKRRGGKSYSVPKRHADALIARGLATDEQPAKAKTDSTE
ncbi:hypothetical protein F7R01_00850 [Pseudomonas argentinensis]|uniref:Uncharacterized protein n=1 Tax=Phytopseudomonas argentinensis TaxID=289370 RepID=A0A1I3NTM5_9GAMM|nr:hypothetical protein [Pseudomonas argentinensis]KAB0549804.1 hypothetical protein F7R01_00850 [Pseudomonas argentinensis]SFJ12360.1 hypothetical protein SAMN05216602_4005 [Pseudomonas argentinensis]